MTSSRSGILTAALALALLAPISAQAGPAGDALLRCVDGALTKPDKALLGRWMFVAMSAYPETQKIVTVPASQMDTLNKGVAALFKRLIGQNCAEKTQQAMGTEGKTAVEDVLKSLVQAGVKELITDPAVGKQLQGLQKYMDEK